MGEIGVALFLIGVYIVAKGLRGRRVGATPHCPNRRCGYPIDTASSAAENAREHGEAAPWPATCSECGTVVPWAGGAAFGVRRRRPRLIALGAAVLALGLGAFVVKTRSPSVPLGQRWIAVMPDDMLMRRVLDANTRLSHLRGASSTSTPLTEEMRNRLWAGRLSSSPSARTIRALLDLQASDHTQWHPVDELLRHLVARGAFDAAGLDRAFHQSFAILPTPPITAHAGLPMQIGMELIWRGVDSPAPWFTHPAAAFDLAMLPEMTEAALATEWRVLDASIDGQPIAHAGWRFGMLLPNSFGAGDHALPIVMTGDIAERDAAIPAAPTTPGAYILTLTLERAWLDRASKRDHHALRNAMLPDGAEARERAWFSTRGIAPDATAMVEIPILVVDAPPPQTRVPIRPEFVARRVQAPMITQGEGGGYTLSLTATAAAAHAVGDLTHSPLLLGEVTLVCGDFTAPLGAIDSQRRSPMLGGFTISPEHASRIRANAGASIVVRLRPEWGVHYPEHRSVFEGEFTLPLLVETTP